MILSLLVSCGTPAPSEIPETDGGSQPDPATEAATESATEAETEPATEAETEPAPSTSNKKPVKFLDLPQYEGKYASNRVVKNGSIQMLYLKGTDEESYLGYRSALENAGYALHDAHEAADNLFATYTGHDTVINVYYMAVQKAIRVVAEPADSTALPIPPSQAKEFEKVCEPAIALVGQSFFWSNDYEKPETAGLGMIIRLSDGRLIVIDGGFTFATNPNHLLKAMQELSPTKKITVAAWIISHGHGDHTQAFLAMVKQNGPQYSLLTIESIIHNVPDPDGGIKITHSSEVDASRKVLKLVRSIDWCDIITAHTGQVITFADATIEMLYTPEDCYPAVINANSPYTYNTTSLIFRISLGGQTLMALTDSSEKSSEILVQNYKEYLKSDMVQIAHHGHVGGTVPLYNYIDAPVVLWPSGWNSLENSMKRECNKEAIKHAEQVFVAGNLLSVMELPHTIVNNMDNWMEGPENWMDNSPRPAHLYDGK